MFLQNGKGLNKILWPMAESEHAVWLHSTKTGLPTQANSGHDLAAQCQWLLWLLQGAMLPRDLRTGEGTS
jgi:hypothetical protein